MTAQDAVTMAKKHIHDLYFDEQIIHVGLEEIALDDDNWRVTIGFSRPWDISPMTPIEKSLLKPRPRPRTYKLIIVRDSDGEVLSVEHRDLLAS